VAVPVSLSKGVLELDVRPDEPAVLAGMAVLSDGETMLPAADAARREG